MTSGFLTPEGSARLAAHHATASANGFYRAAQGCLVSSLGVGTYLGALDDAADAAYHEAVQAAVSGGINVIDTAINYRNQRSERSIGSALREIFASRTAARDELLVCTKAGFLTQGVKIALAGMSSVAHVRENLRGQAFAPADVDSYLTLFEREE